MLSSVAFYRKYNIEHQASWFWMKELNRNELHQSDFSGNHNLFIMMIVYTQKKPDSVYIKSVMFCNDFQMCAIRLMHFIRPSDLAKIIPFNIKLLKSFNISDIFERFELKNYNVAWKFTFGFFSVWFDFALFCFVLLCFSFPFHCSFIQHFEWNSKFMNWNSFFHAIMNALTQTHACIFVFI